ncbi:hypothetical protein HAX54_000894 [Datura stramonium]|uniref:Uncharacterized protein n=1 Tax=Datura stramonium TaxID=4076 RepID=A0ABS8WTA3_DATST|nr:hypothetical protein [Datura stramonium]
MMMYLKMVNPSHFLACGLWVQATKKAYGNHRKHINKEKQHHSQATLLPPTSHLSPPPGGFITTTFPLRVDFSTMLGIEIAESDFKEAWTNDVRHNLLLRMVHQQSSEDINSMWTNMTGGVKKDRVYGLGVQSSSYCP